MLTLTLPCLVLFVKYLIFRCFVYSVTVTGAVTKSLFKCLVQSGTDEADETLKTVRFKVVITKFKMKCFSSYHHYHHHCPSLVLLVVSRYCQKACSIHGLV